jgi:16S rRNA (adenine1518-N6/adenine1519-N6)-dimethyltransferase
MSAPPHLARKRFGQHFLSDRWVLDSIVEAIDPQHGEAVVEIGPGLGALTYPLLQRCQPLTVIELDRDLAAKLRQRSVPGAAFSCPSSSPSSPTTLPQASEGSALNVIESDVLKVDFAALAQRLGRPKIRVVGNLPYNISTPILFHLLGAVDHIADQHFMLQKEVVERMAASPGSKDYGRLSVMLQWRYRIEHLFDVGPEAFTPPPRVDSAVVRMVPLPEPIGINHTLLGEVVSVAFSQRRKILRNTLGKWLEASAYTGTFDVQRRAEEVPVQEYLDLVRALLASPLPLVGEGAPQGRERVLLLGKAPSP